MSLFPSHSAQCLQDLLDAYEEGDVEKFTQVVVEFDRLSPIDSWKTSILLRVKKSIGDEDLV